MLTKTGWVWLETPFKVPQYVLDKKTLNRVGMEQVDLLISAFGWFPTSDSQATEFMCFFDYASAQFIRSELKGAYGFSPWSYFGVRHGEKVMPRIQAFEEKATKEGGNYAKNRTTEAMHEIRWIYAALHLMSQRLAHHSQHEPDRAIRRRAERNRQTLPDRLRVVSLRRLEEDRKKEPGAAVKVDWQWQWTVQGHWRNQWFPSTKSHRQVFIESYLKGPEDKPLKPMTHTIFTAVR